MEMKPAIEKLLAAILDDYASFQDAIGDESVRKTQMRMREEFEKSLSFSEGKKYIKIVKDGSVWGFVVNTNNDEKFRYGDILKPASWASPVRNSPRGNVFENYEVQWTGPLYLR
jgi:hypothetical protein